MRAEPTGQLTDDTSMAIARPSGRNAHRFIDIETVLQRKFQMS